jgi:hypothetical protein
MLLWLLRGFCSPAGRNSTSRRISSSLSTRHLLISSFIRYMHLRPYFSSSARSRHQHCIVLPAVAAMPSLTALQAFLFEADRGRYELNALRLATTGSSRHQLGVALAELNQVKTDAERQWTLFYLLRTASTMDETANLYKGLLRYLYEGDHWIDGLGVDRYLTEIEYERHFAGRRESLDLPNNWIALATNRLTARWAAKAEELAAQQILPAVPNVKPEDKANVKKRRKPTETGEKPSKRRSLSITSDLAPTSKPIEQADGEQPLATQKRKKKSKRFQEDEEGQEEPAVPRTLWDAVVDDEYRKTIGPSGVSFMVLSSLLTFLISRYGREWTQRAAAQPRRIPHRDGPTRLARR